MVFQAFVEPVHGLGFIGLEFAVSVFLQDGTGIAVEVDGNGIAGFLGYNVDEIFVDAAGFLDDFRVRSSIPILQPDLGAVGRDEEMIDPHQLFTREEDDRLLDNLEFGLIAFDIVLSGKFVP